MPTKTLFLDSANILEHARIFSRPFGPGDFNPVRDSGFWPERAKTRKAEGRVPGKTRRWGFGQLFPTRKPIRRLPGKPGDPVEQVYLKTGGRTGGREATRMLMIQLAFGAVGPECVVYTRYTCRYNSSKGSQPLAGLGRNLGGRL